jgi:flagellar basal-body rod protein FlgC
MLTAASNALSAFARRQAVTAHNIANINTDGYKAKSLPLEELPDRQGAQAQKVQEDSSPGPLKEGIVEKNGENGSRFEMQTVEGSNTSLVNELTSLMQNENAFEANAKVVRVSQEMSGRILDLVA